MRVSLPPSGVRRGYQSIRRAFTLVELLIVIGIIALLVGITLPVVGKVRVSAQRVASENTINRLVQGCEAYYSDFAAYPGPFGDNEVVPASTAAIGSHPRIGMFDLQLLNSGAAAPVALAKGLASVTSSENLFVGLCGGLRLTYTTAGVPNAFVFDVDAAKQANGPRWFSDRPKKSQGYLQIAASDISVGDDNRNPLTDGSSPASLWWPNAPAGPAFVGTFQGDSELFEFMDRFARPRPILFMRAQRGVSRTTSNTGDRSGFVYDPTNAASQASTSPWQYRPEQVQVAYSNVGVDRNKMAQAGRPWTADATDYPVIPVDPNVAVTPVVLPPAAVSPNVKIAQGNEHYFANEQLSTGDPTTTGNGSNSLIPVHKDGFILICAGADGIYGTADDIRN